MKLNKKHLAMLRKKRLAIDKQYRSGAVLYRGYFITRHGFHYVAMVEGKRGLLVHTGMYSVLSATIISQIQSGAQNG